MLSEIDTTPFERSNGQLEINLGWRGGWQTVVFDGGPYDFYPGKDKAFGVCVRAERAAKLEKDVHIPIQDFSVPSVLNEADVRGALYLTYEAVMRDDRRVYIGCMGGWGRTGLFMALLAKAAGIEDPVGYVRANYTPMAIETERQKSYVENFDVDIMPKVLNRWGRARLVRKLKSLVGFKSN